MSLSKLFMVARWEFTEKIRTKAFLVALFVTPLISVSFMIIPMLLINKENDTTKSYAIYDATGQLTKTVSDSLHSKYRLKDGKPMYEIVPAAGANVDKIIAEYKQRVLNEEFEGIFVIPENIVKERKTTYYSTNVASEQDIRNVASEIEGVFIDNQLRKTTLILLSIKKLANR
mgnify:CR=1 FL=1